MNQILQIYKTLLKNYGSQGWWPLLDCKGCNPTKTGSIRGYHPGDYSYPRTDAQRFEICVGAILTQNTAWPNVEKALTNLKKSNSIDAAKIKKMSVNRLTSAIKPAGYFNQKAKKLKIFADFYLSLKGRTPTREQLLSVWGVGKETADSILLYAYKVPIFVVDAYTKRIFSRAKFFKENSDYDDVRHFFEKSLTKDWKVFQEFHALIVEHAKRHCMKLPNCTECTFDKKCGNESIYDKLWRFAEPYYLKARPNDVDHIQWMLSEAKKMAKEESLDETILLPLVILHDVGYVGFGKEYPFDRDVRRLHMKRGKEIAIDILGKTGYPKRKSNAIVNLVGVHDNWAFGDYRIYLKDKNLAAFNDLDFVWAATQKGFWLMKKYLKLSKTELIDYLKNDPKVKKNMMYTKYGERLFSKLIAERSV
ncbi:MAG: hypothetical protein V1837_05485 [Candidatus Woesearchaeota archaeon]